MGPAGYMAAAALAAQQQRESRSEPASRSGDEDGVRVADDFKLFGGDA